MNHSTKIGGTNYNIVGGTTKISGTNYNITGGTTLINGTNYNISFTASEFILFDNGTVSGVNANYGYWGVGSGQIASVSPTQGSPSTGAVSSIGNTLKVAIFNATSPFGSLEYIGFVTLGPIDVTSYSKLYFYAKNNVDTKTFYCGIVNSFPSKEYENESSYNLSTAQTLLEFNLSNISGMQYIQFRGGGLMTTDPAEIFQVWLEK